MTAWLVLCGAVGACSKQQYIILADGELPWNFHFNFATAA